MADDRDGFQRMNDYSTFCFCKGPEFHINIFLLFFFASFAALPVQLNSEGQRSVFDRGAKYFWFPNKSGFPPHSTGGQVCYAPTCLPWLGIQNLIQNHIIIISLISPTLNGQHSSISLIGYSPKILS